MGDVVWFSCGSPGCTYKSKYSGNLNRHKHAVHAIAPVAGTKRKFLDAASRAVGKERERRATLAYVDCGVNNCSYKTNIQVSDASTTLGRGRGAHTPPLPNRRT